MGSLDTLKIDSDSLNVFAQQANSSYSHSWIWILISSSVVILLIIIILLVYNKAKAKPSNNLNVLRQTKEHDNVDFGNVINSAFNSRQLYDKLKKKCHPDLFPLDNEKNAIATDIFQRIKQNEHNVDELKKLKEEAEEKLGIVI